MKRRGFLGRLAALMVAPAVAPELLKSEETGYNRPFPGLVDLPAPGKKFAKGATMPKAESTPWSICEAFAKKFQLELEKAPGRNAAIFRLKFPLCEKPAAFSAGLTNLGHFTLVQDEAGNLTPVPLNNWKAGLYRQLKYQMVKMLEAIERDHGWRGTPPGVVQSRPAAGVAFASSDYLPAASSPVYTENTVWVWEKENNGHYIRTMTYVGRD